MADGFTPAPEPPDQFSYRDVIAMPTPTICWRMHGCVHHVKELIKLERQAGARYVWHVFRSNQAFCGACWSYEHGHEPTAFSMPQVPMKSYFDRKV